MIHGRVRLLQAVALGAATVAALALLGQLLLTPTQGEILVLASARQSDRIPGATIELHSNAGWIRIGTFTNRSVPAAPGSATLVDGMAPVASYDAIRLDGRTYSAGIEVGRVGLETVLLAVADGHPVVGGIYAGSQTVSLGLNELAGHLRQMPPFNLIDQFGRPFTNESIAGHDVILAAFHISCHATCPLYTGLFLQLRRQLPSSVMLVEATTAPDEDSPDALRAYAGALGASWTFATGTPEAVASFWATFTVQLSDAQAHSSTLAFVDSHGYVRTYYLGTPDVGGQLPAELVQQLSSEGLSEYRSHGNGWGATQVVDTLRSIDALASPSTGGEGPAAGFSLQTLDGHRANLSDYVGRPVLINFWATYCVPCRVEMPLIQRMADSHPKLVVLLVDERDSTPAARAFVAQLGIRSTVLLDTDGKSGDLYRIVGLPTTIFIRADGSVEGRYLGQTDARVLGSHIAAIGD